MEDNKNNTAEEEVTIDFGKVKKFFKKEKQAVQTEEKAVEARLEKEEGKLEALKEKKADVDFIISKEEETVKELKQKEEKLMKKEKIIENNENAAESAQEEVSLDLKKIKNLFKRKEKIDLDVGEEKEEPLFDPRKAWQFIVKHKALFLILIPILFSIYFRAFPIYMPITDDWARSTVYSNIQNSISSQINQQYPNLPDKQKTALVQKQFDDILKQEETAIENQITATSQYFKTRMENPDNEPYLSDIDTWMWYGYAKAYLKNGYFGNEIINGEERYTLRNGRDGQSVQFIAYAWVMAMNYKFLSFFSGISLMQSVFYLVIILMAISSAAAFVIGKKIAGYPAALAAGVLIAAQPALLGRTISGDDDVLHLTAGIVALMVFALAFDEKDRKKQWIYIALAGLAMGIYSRIHVSWFMLFDAIAGALVIYLAYQIIINRKELKKGIEHAFKNEKIQNTLRVFLGFVGFTWIFGLIVRMMVGDSFIQSIHTVLYDPIQSPLTFLVFKQVAIESVWPNVFTTVAELNPSSLTGVIAQAGGKLMFLFAILGIIFLILKKEKGERKYEFYGILLALWMLGATYSAITSIRFIEFFMLPFTFSLAAFVAFVYTDLSRWLKEEIHLNEIVPKIVLILVIVVIIFLPVLNGASALAKQHVASMNDAWYDSLVGIKADSNDSIITSWWDFGHWFVSVAERRVTFDGGDQGERIHWVGKSLITPDEQVSLGLLRMMNCGQEKAPHIIEKYVDGDTVKAVDILNRIVIEDKEAARKILEKENLSENAIDDILNVTHCDDLLPQYYITSDDMIGKAGVWGHFGSWNFTKASMYTKVHNKQKEEGIRILTEEFGLGEDDASNIYYEIKTTSGDQWVSPWPGYMGVSGCSVKSNIVTCSNGVLVNLTDYSALVNTNSGAAVPYSIVYADKSDIHEKVLNNSKIGVSVLIVPDGSGYKAVIADPLQATSMFTRLFFFKGHGSECFDLFSYQKSFTGNEIFVWKVDWECQTKSVMDELKEKEVVKEEKPEITAIETNNTNNSNSTAKVVNKSGFEFDIS